MSGVDAVISWPAALPTSPAEGKCDRLLDLLRHICSGNGDSPDVYEWVLRWLAYPIQHPGAKMKSALVVHGPQGVGKSLFFRAYMQIFGGYGRVVRQEDIEDKFNEWASRTLFLLVDDVVAYPNLRNFRKKLKALIVDDVIQIDRQCRPRSVESNRANLALLSSEPKPFVADADERRYALIRAPSPQSPAFYDEVQAEIANDGFAALHAFLLNLDLGDFGPDTPPMTMRRAAQP
jgi:putative DNA primase/helicase